MTQETMSRQAGKHSARSVCRQDWLLIRHYTQKQWQ